MPRKKNFADATTFQVLHRSQRDPLSHLDQDEQSQISKDKGGKEEEDEGIFEERGKISDPRLASSRVLVAKKQRVRCCLTTCSFGL
jgi:hypothetical protein